MEKQFVERAKDKEFENRLKSIDLVEDEEEPPVTTNKQSAKVNKK